MALQDIGMFLPAESNYKRPGAYDQMLRAEALKNARNLSNMDQFYENLNEAQRQFNATLAFKTETRDLELEFGREKLDKTLAMQEAQLEAQKEYQSKLLDLQERELDIKETALEGEEEPWTPIYRRSEPSDIMDFLAKESEKNRQAVFGTSRMTTSVSSNAYPEQQTANYGPISSATSGALETTGPIWTEGEEAGVWGY